MILVSYKHWKMKNWWKILEIIDKEILWKRNEIATFESFIYQPLLINMQIYIYLGSSNSVLILSRINFSQFFKRCGIKI